MTTSETSGLSGMVQTRNCLSCGAPIRPGAPDGLCPRCLLGLGLRLHPGASPLPRPQETRPEGRSLGTGLFGDYELLDEIARGGMGIVYRARQVSLKRIVAIKLLLFGQFASEPFVKRFRAEAEAVASLRHSNIVGIHAVGEHQNQPFFSMDYIEGTNLAGLVKERPLTAIQSARLVKTLAEAIDYAHSREILHCDLKPSNVLIDLEGKPHITDFGLARRFNNDSHLTLTGQIFGSPGYMAPEQALPAKGKLGRACDIYSLGAILYFVATGRPPYDAGSVEATLMELITGEILSPRRLNPSLPRDLETICLKCLERDPNRRYATAGELAAELGRFLEGQPIRARPITILEKAWRWSARNPLTSGLSALTIMLLIGFVGYTLVSSQRFRLEAARARLAQQQSLTNLWESYLAQARAKRRSRQAGQRYASIEAIRRAAAIRPSLELRNEAIAALALPDVRLTQTWPIRDSGVVVAYSPTLARFAVEREGGEISVCLASNGIEVARLPSVGHRPHWICGFTPDEKLLAVYYYEDLNYVWDIAARKPVARPIPGIGCTFVPEEDQLLVAQSNSTLGFFSLRSGAALRSIPSPESLQALAIHHRSRLIGGFRHGSSVVHLIDLNSGQERFALQHPADVGSLAFSFDGQSMAVGCYDKQVHVWDTRTGASRAVFPAHENNVTAVGFNHAGTLLATTSWDDTFRLWDTASWRCVLMADGTSYEMRFGPEDRSLANLQQGGVAGVLEIASSTEFHELYGSSEDLGGGSCSAMSPDSRLLATSHANAAVIRDAANGAELARLPVEDCRSVLFMPDGRAVITSGGSGLTIWPITISGHDTRDEVALGTPQRLCESALMGAALSYDGRWVAAANKRAASVFVCETANPENYFEFTNAPYIESLSATADMHWLAAGTWGGTGVKVWNVPQRQLERELSFPQMAHVQFSPDGKLLAAGGRVYRVWQTGSWRTLYDRQKLDSESGVGQIAFSPDSRWLAVVERRDIVLVEAATGTELARFQSPRQLQISGLCFSPQSPKLFASQTDQSIQVWDLDATRRQLAALNLDW